MGARVDRMSRRPTLTLKDWLNSKVHRKNLLGKDYTEVGIGVATNDLGETYFTQDFGRPQK